MTAAPAITARSRIDMHRPGGEKGRRRSRAEGDDAGQATDEARGRPNGHEVSPGGRTP